MVADTLQKRRRTTQIRKNIGKEIHISDRATDILPWESALSGAIAGAAATLLVYPSDTVKSAIQTEEELRTPSRQAKFIDGRPTTFWRAASKVYRAHGFKGFYAGCGMTVARSIPSSGIIFVVYDGLRQWLC
jgi:ornithine carrier protein